MLGKKKTKKTFLGGREGVVMGYARKKHNESI
jgi:hypothetical protein